MEKNYRVAIHYNEDLGYIEYDLAAKKINITLPNSKMKAIAEEYFAKPHEISVPHETLRDFTKTVINPSNSLEEFKLALTRLWGTTEIHVDWSRPVDLVIQGI
jgi:hypothetical protein